MGKLKKLHQDDSTCLWNCLWKTGLLLGRGDRIERSNPEWVEVVVDFATLEITYQICSIIFCSNEPTLITKPNTTFYSMKPT